MFVRSILTVGLGFMLCGQAAAQTQPAVAKPKIEEKAASPTWKISGYMIGDYY